MIAHAMQRDAMFTVLRWTVLATISLTACYRASNTRSFAGTACPAGWRFVYSEHLHRQVMCARDTTRVREWPVVTPGQSK
jgi:hypothetical protein